MQKLKYVKPNVVILYLFFISIIYQSGTVQAANNQNDFLYRLTLISMLAIGLWITLLSLNKKRYKELQVIIMLFIFMEVFAVIHYFLHSGSAIKLQYKILTILILFFVATYCKSQEIKADIIFFHIIRVIALYTLILYVIIGIFRIDLPYTIFHGQVILYRNYWGLYYSYSNKLIPRLSGIFWEPGVYQIYLNLALYFYYKNEIKDKKSLILICANLVFTQSTTGYIIGALLIGAIIVQTGWIFKFKKRIRKILLPIIALMAAGFAFIYKYKTTYVAGDSFYDRVEHFTIAFRLFLSKPLLGYGFYNTEVFEKAYRIGGGNSGGLLTLMYTTGLVGLAFFLYPFIKDIRMQKRKEQKQIKIVFLLYFVLINVTEPVYSLPLICYLVSYEYVEIMYQKRMLVNTYTLNYISGQLTRRKIE